MTTALPTVPGTLLSIFLALVGRGRPILDKSNRDKGLLTGSERNKLMETKLWEPVSQFFKASLDAT